MIPWDLIHEKYSFLDCLRYENSWDFNFRQKTINFKFFKKSLNNNVLKEALSTYLNFDIYLYLLIFKIEIISFHAFFTKYLKEIT